MSADEARRVDLVRTGPLQLTATNARGGSITMDSGGGTDFTPVELLLAAIAGCTGMDVDAITGKRAAPEVFGLTATADKVRDGGGNHLTAVRVDFDVRFPDSDAGRAADAVLSAAIHKSHDRLCTVSRTVELPTPITVTLRGESLP